MTVVRNAKITYIGIFMPYVVYGREDIAILL